MLPPTTQQIRGHDQRAGRHHEGLRTGHKDRQTVAVDGPASDFLCSFVRFHRRTDLGPSKKRQNGMQVCEQGKPGGRHTNSPAAEDASTLATSQKLPVAFPLQ
jgi:hypothetical protein